MTHKRSSKSSTQLEKMPKAHSGRRGWMLVAVVSVTLAAFNSASLPVASQQSTVGQQQQQQQQHQHQMKPAANEQSPSLNLIPVDQPIASNVVSRNKYGDNTDAEPPTLDQGASVGGGGGGTGSSGFHTRPAAATVSSPDSSSSYNFDSSGGLEGGVVSQDEAHTLGEQDDNSNQKSYSAADNDLPAADKKTAQQMVDSSSLDGFVTAVNQQQQQQQFTNEQAQLAAAVAQMPATVGRYQANAGVGGVGGGGGQVAAQQMVERRFGMFKKQQQHYGSPMSSNYVAANPYMSDCERCLAGLGQQSADLQQLDPLPPPPAPMQPLIPAPSGAHIQPFSAPPLGPLKNKLFMKFPFFMKPISLGTDSYSAHPEAVPAHWHHQYHHQPPPPTRPQMTSALYLRPAPAYNCIQTAPPLISAASSQHQEVAALGTKTGQSKQYPHQQTTYSSSQY